MGSNANARILSLCGELRMPAAFLERVRETVPQSRAVHFGFEQGETAQLYKVYLEVGAPPGESTPEPRLLHVGLKWDIHDPGRRAVTEYILHPRISAAAINRRLALLYEHCAGGEGLEIARALVSLAVRRMPAEALQYLEVSESGNPRSSYDLNAYDAGFRLRDLYPLLIRLCQLHSIEAEVFASLYVRIEDRAFGHLAGGLHRDGTGFSTVYYGVEWHGQPESPA
jgi:hypothetical protein